VSFTLRVDSRRRGRRRQSPHGSLLHWLPASAGHAGRLAAGLLIAGAVYLAGGALTIQSGQAVDSATIVRSGDNIVVKDSQNPVSCGGQAAPSFRFSPTKHGSTFECSLDRAPFGVCEAVHTLRAVKDGAHVLRVRARDRFGALDLSPAEHAFSVDTVAPRIARGRLSASKRLSYRLSERATVRITVAHGKRSRTLIREAARGANPVGLKRVVRRLKARAGRLTLVATDRAGNRSRPLRLRLK
jgi:hypothetical protein